MTQAFKTFIAIKDASLAHKFLMENATSAGTATCWKRNWQLKYNKKLKSLTGFKVKTEETKEAENTNTETKKETNKETRNMETQTDIDMTTFQHF